MTGKPLVSVVVPTYNRPDFLIKTMRSILNQTYKNIELIVISNGKSDENERAAKSFDDDRVIYADQENSGGPSGPRNHGMRLSKGEYIAVCDDDDLWLPEKLEAQVSAMERNPSCGLCYTGMISFDETGKEWSGKQEQTDFETLRYKNVIPISSVVMKADIVSAQGGFDESKLVGDSEDYEFVLRHAFQTKLLFIDQKLLKYWAGENRTTSTDDGRTISADWRHLKDVVGCHYLVIKKTGVSPARFVLPFFYHLRICVKSSAYLLYRKMGLAGE